MNIPWYVHCCYTKTYGEYTKIVKNGRNSYYINIPKEFMKELKWKERQKLVVTKRGTKITITDWKK